MFIFLLVGGIPWNSPLCVPVKLRNTTTLPFSATICSIFAWISGNAVNNSFSDFLNPSLPSPIEGFSLAKYFSLADILCSLNTSSTNDLMTFFSLDNDIDHLVYIFHQFIVILAEGQGAQD